MYRSKEVALVLLGMLFCSLFLMTGCGSSSAKAAELLELAVNHLSENKFEEAVLAYREAIKIEPKNGHAYKGLSVAYSMQGKKEQAEQALQEGLKKVPDGTPLQLAMAELLFDEGKVEQAEGLYKEILARDGKYLPTYRAYSKLLVALGKREEAIALLENAASDYHNYKMYSLLADLYLKNGDREKALFAFYSSLTLEPNQADSYHLLEVLYTGRWEEYSALGDQYMQQNQVVPGQVIKLYALYKLGRYEELVQRFDQLPGDLKANPVLRVVSAQAYVIAGKPDQALDLLKNINTGSIKDAALMAEIASSLLKAGDKEAARKLAVQGIGLDDTAAENYGVLYRSYQQENKAQSELWKIKFIISSADSLTQAQKELELKISRESQNTANETNAFSEIDKKTGNSLEEDAKKVASPVEVKTDYIINKQQAFQDAVSQLGIRLGASVEEIKSKFGEPDRTEDWGGGLNGACLSYDRKGMAYIIGDNGYFKKGLMWAMFGSPNYNFAGVKVGMSLSEVRGILGKPDYEDYDISGESDNWVLNYNSGSYHLGIFAKDSSSPVELIEFIYN